MENKELSEMRREIDNIDRSLMSLLDKRANIAKAIGEIKKQAGLPIFNKQREDEILTNTNQFGNSGFVSSIFANIFEESRRLQEEKCK